MHLRPSAMLLALAAQGSTTTHAQIAPRGIAVLSHLVERETSVEIEEEVDAVIAYYEGGGCVLLLPNFVFVPFWFVSGVGFRFAAMRCWFCIWWIKRVREMSWYTKNQIDSIGIRMWSIVTYITNLSHRFIVWLLSQNKDEYEWILILLLLKWRRLKCVKFECWVTCLGLMKRTFQVCNDSLSGFKCWALFTW